ncbi:hypothetical protein H4R33_004167 [Dimargaris cristalligena]|uniref:F-box domain-containing protein n=1 Tax=Dimargaris cristalligena TaxID=215637 RepID=A0A4Q0A1M7_9FUNG|nr:hypothetical protein H4R33_004167 [Dimargaris cristalligena]RKP39954.1 hypothetical protein BJ085DRAFT_35183 [Dimargaris cristalligena]|eukprot:RKP39954.1 hypothetical protein BJ085DRAFT_35183 [Dimargaris cristalligena]
MLADLCRVLPYDDLHQLVKLCGLTTSLNLASVNQELRDLILPLCLRSVEFNSSTCPDPLGLVRMCQSHGHLVRRFRADLFRAARSFPPRPTLAPHDILPYLTQLEELHLYWANGLTSTALHQWLPVSTHRLRKVTLQQDPAHLNAGLFTSIPAEYLSAMPHLTSLRLEGFQSDLAQSWAALFLTHPQIRVLTLPKRVSSAAVTSIASHLPHLRSLELNLTHVDVPALHRLARSCRHLTHLTLSGLTPENSLLLEAMHPDHWPGLRYLKIQQDDWDPSQPETSAIQAIRFQRLFGRVWPHLRTVALRYTAVDDLTLTLIARHCPQLRRISLAMCYPGATTTGYRYLFEHSRRLRAFSLESDEAQNIQSDILPAKQFASSRLRRLHLYISQVDPQHFVPILSQLHQLQDLVISRNCQRSDFSLLQQECPHLRIKFH